MKENFHNFRERIIFYRGSIHQIEAHLDEFVNFTKDSYSKLNTDLVIPITGSRLVYRNIVTRKHEISDMRSAEINNLEEKISEVKNHYANYCTAQCFESLLKNLLTSYYISNPEFCHQNEIELKITDFTTCKESLVNSIKGKRDNKYNKQ
ncbi:MAG: hypothetical protein COC01_08315 [Bacteroidetes bacterium]|nr:hypothetical protein [Bacteroidia bacterium]PCH66340.1 MAG: hypothetical protein COC01_08315 [Bacteroidota bacterium]